jgi:DNA-binding NtrC family response regulator
MIIMIEIRVPLHAFAGYASGNDAKAAKNGAKTKIREMQLHVLIVDDDDVFRTEFKRKLERYGIAVADAADVFTAIEMLNEQPFDLVLLDNWLDEMTGDKAYPLIRETKGCRRVAMMSTDASACRIAADLELDFYAKLDDDATLERILLDCERGEPQ